MIEAGLLLMADQNRFNKKMNINQFKKISELSKSVYSTTDDNIVSVGFGFKSKAGVFTKETCLVFTVKEKFKQSDVPAENLIPEKIHLEDGEYLNTDVVQGEYFAAISNCSDLLPPPSNRNKFRPLKGGISISNYTKLPQRASTLGFIAIDLDDNSLVGISNAHSLVDDAFFCSDRNASGIRTNAVNNAIVQPNEILNSDITNSIGIVKKYFPLNKDALNTVDVGVFTISKNDLNSDVSITQEGLNYTSWLPFASSQEINNLISSNSDLYTSGRTSGPRGEESIKLKVNQLNVSATINYNLQGSYEAVDFTNCIQFYAEDESQPGAPAHYCPVNYGDSGSALIADIGGIRKIVGMVFAMQTDSSGNIVAGLANRIDDIANSINIEHWDGDLSCPIVFSDTANSETIILSGLDNRESISINNKRYWQVGLEPITQYLFNKASFIGKVPEPYLGYLNQAVDRWSQYIKFNSKVYSHIKSIDPSFDGIYMLPNSSNPVDKPNGFEIYNSNSSVIASCSPTSYYDLVTDSSSVKFNASSFSLSINEYNKSSYSQGDWVNIFTHELGHALGIGVFWSAQFQNDGSVPPSDYFLDGASYINCRNAYKNIANNSIDYTKIPLEDSGGGGTVSAHWEDKYRDSSKPGSLGLNYPGFQNELMRGSYSAGSQMILSSQSIAILLDFGYEEVNPGTSESGLTLSSISYSSDDVKLNECCARIDGIMSHGQIIL